MKQFNDPEQSSKLPNGLYLVATPIGNLADISKRALETLQQVDIIACEDSRVTRKLLSAYGIKATLWAYHEHNAQKVRPEMMNRVADGASIALVSDAGMPLVSDPGYKLVRAFREANLPVTAIPGASAPLTALILSGQPTDHFYFGGFLPTKTKAREALLTPLKTLPASLIFFESPRRLAETLSFLSEIFGPMRQASVCRELTKLFEEIKIGSLSELAEFYQSHGAPKGEIVLVLAGASSEDAIPDEAEMDALITAEISKGKKLKEIARDLSEKYPLKKRDLYNRALFLKDQK